MITLKRVHWLCIYLVVFSLFFISLFFDVKQKLIQIGQRRIVEKNVLDAIEINKRILLNAMLNQQKSLLKVDNTLLEKSDILAYITDFFMSRGITVNKVQLLKIRTAAGVNTLPVKVNAIGNFAEFTQLLTGLAASFRPILVNDFSLQIDKNGVMMAEMQLWFFAMHTKAFKVPDQEPQAVNMHTLLHGVSVKKMKWVGFLRHEQAIWGLLVLPAGQTVEVQAGSIIGVEKGRVVEVKEDGVIVDLMEKKIRIGSSIKKL